MNGLSEEDKEKIGFNPCFYWNIIFCGMFGDIHAKEMKKEGIELINYDKYIHGEQYLKQLNMNEIECIICSNVLNVIPNNDEIINLLKWFKAQNKVVYISLYEGDRSNQTKLNKNGCYQRNQTKASFYNQFLKDDYKKEKGFFKLD